MSKKRDNKPYLETGPIPRRLYYKKVFICVGRGKKKKKINITSIVKSICLNWEVDALNQGYMVEYKTLPIPTVDLTLLCHVDEKH